MVLVSCFKSGQSDPASGTAITPVVAAGQKIWEDNRCFGCHSVLGEGTVDAPKLTGVVEARGRNWLRTFFIAPESVFPGPRKMAKYEFTEGQIDSVIAYLEWCARVDAVAGAPPDGQSSSEL